MPKSRTSNQMPEEAGLPTARNDKWYKGIGLGQPSSTQHLPDERVDQKEEISHSYANDVQYRETSQIRYKP